MVLVDMAYVQQNLLKLQSFVVKLTIANFKEANNASLFQRVKWVNGMNGIITNLGLWEILKVAFLKDWMDLNLHVDIWQRLILLLDCGVSAVKVEGNLDLPDQVNVGLFLLFGAAELHDITDRKVLVRDSAA